MTTRSRRRAAVAMVALAALAAGCDRGEHASEVDFTVPVKVAEVSSGDVEDLVMVTGTLRAEETVTLAVETGGVLAIGRGADGGRLREGDRVAAGQVVAEVTGEDVRLAARTAATEQRYQAAERDLAATRQLVADGLVADSELRRAETTLADARLDYDRSRHSEARNRLVTPIAGVILSLARDAQGQPMASGQQVAPGAVVARIAATAALVADVDLVGGDVARVAVGQSCRVSHHALTGRVFDGRVAAIAPTVDPSTRALKAEVDVANPERLLKPGMFVEVAIVGERRLQVPVVAREAVTDRAGKRVAFVLVGQRVERREVALGLGDDATVEVVSGLAVGERVVVRGLETLKDGMRVRVSGNE